MKKLLALVAVLVLVAMIWALAPRDEGGAVEQQPQPTQPARTAPAERAVVILDAIAATDDPDAYARAIAGVVLGMDTRRLAPGDYRDVLVAEADPTLSAKGRADLLRMLSERIPTDEQWGRMRANGQWSTWVSRDVQVPASWEQVVISGQAQPGWAFRNVTGIQTTHYVEDGTARTSSRERTLTIGMRCPADGVAVDRCRLNLVGVNVIP
jgi:hypothetical protein